MSGPVATVFGFVGDVLREAREQQLTFLAAGVAYYLFVSLLPLLLLLVVVAAAVGGDQLADRIVGAASTYLSPTGEGVLLDALTNAAGQTTAGVASVLVLLWSGLRLFRALDLAFSAVYDTVGRESFLGQLRDALVVFAAMVLGGAALVAVGGVLPSLLVDAPYAESVADVALLPTLTLFFLPLYVVFPDAGVSVREALPGAVFLAVGWTALTRVFRVYAATAAGFSIYGFLGAVLLGVLWLYLSSIVIILGAVANAVLAGRTDEKPDEGEPTDDEAEPAGPAPDVAALQRELGRLQAELDEKTVSRSDLEAELRAYVRRRLRRGHARGWGPYLVLLYGTAMTIGAFYFLRGGWSILAMVVVWLSTLGLYVLMLLVGVGANALGVPGRALDWVRSLRS